MTPVRWPVAAAVFGVASVALLATSCASRARPLPSFVASETGAPVQVRIVAVRPEAMRTHVDIEVAGRGGPGAAVCLGYPSFRFRQGERVREYGTVGGAVACATPRIPAGKGEITRVPVEIVAVGLPTRDGALQLRFPVFVVAPGSPRYGGDVVSAEFALSPAAAAR